MRELCIFIAVFACYATLGQTALYLDDGFRLIGGLVARDIRHTSHELYLPQLVAFGDLLAPLGLPPHRVITLLSALGSAAGVALFHRALRWLEPERAGLQVLATALVATTPAVVFFATVVEYHGFFFGFAQLAFLATVALVRHPSAWRAGLLGIACALATLVHSTGVLLPVILLPVFVVECKASLRGKVFEAALVIVTHLAGVFLGVLLLRALGIGVVPEIPPLNGSWLSAQWPGIPRALWREWGLPYAPVCVGLLLSIGHRSTRRLGLWVGMAVLLYAVATGLALGPTLWERGAYLGPLVGPAALLTARAMPRAWCGLLVALGAVGALGQVITHDRASAGYALFVSGVYRAAGDSVPRVLIAARSERAAVTVLDAVPNYIYVGDHVALSPPEFESSLRHLKRGLDAQRTPGSQLLISDASLDALRSTAQGQMLADALSAQFTLRRVEVDGFAGWRID